MKLYTYWRSSASYRVRIGLNLKGLAYESVPVHLVKDGGEQHSGQYRAINPSRQVPALQLDDGTVLTQSQAILEYLEERHPVPPLLPGSDFARARVRALAQMIACDIHPLNNSKVLKYLVNDIGVDEPTRDTWYRHWIAEGFTALETMLAGARQTKTFCHGEAPTLADVFLVPQLYNARRFKVDLAPFPTLTRIEAACLTLPAFAKAAPEQQPDAA
ncbi:MAG: maleylacetoacetate isomerase [Magnetospiraceae bacterium]